MKIRARLVSRLASIVVAIGSGGVLGLAGWLDPSPVGHSTHTQLGLSPCTIFSMTGWPCPMCGMTTTYSLMAHFRPIDALINQPFGVVLFALTVLVCGIAIAEAVWPTDRWRRILRVLAPWEGWLSGLFVLGMSLGWIWKIAEIRGWW